MSSYVCCVWVILVFGLEGVGTRSHRKLFPGCSISTANQSFSSILLTWSAPNDRTSHRYSVKFWPLYSKHIQEDIVNQTTRYLASRLEPFTLYKFVVQDITSNTRICNVIRRTNTNTFSKDQLKINRINSTLLYATWMEVRVPGANVTYKAFIEWDLPNHTNVELVYYGNRTSVLVRKDFIPHRIRFHVNVNVKRPKLAAGSDIPIRPSPWKLVPSLISRGYNFILITWSPMRGNYSNINYSVLLKSHGKLLNIVSTMKNHALIEKLQQNTAYNLQVRAHNASGDVIERSRWVTFKTKDYDECTSPDNNCHQQAQCINTKGSYYCRCLHGWRGDGHDCQKVPSTQHCVSVYYDGITWPETNIGQQAWLECSPEAYGNVTRKCKRAKESAEWDEPDYSQCVSKDIVSIHDEIQQVFSDPVSNAKKLAYITRNNRQTYSEDIKLIVSSLDILSSEDTMQQVQHARGDAGEQANELAMSVLNISNGILDDHVIPSWKQIKKSSAASLASKIIQSLDGVALLLARNSQDRREVLVNTDNIALFARAVPVDECYTGQWLSPTRDMRKGYSSSVFVPGSVLSTQNISHDGLQYLSLVTYKTIHKVFQTESTLGSASKVLSPVVSVTLNPLHNNKFDKPVVLTITRPKDKAYGDPTCAFLDISNSSSISWSSEGCKVSMFNETHTQCLCYHLTSFAVLMKVTNADQYAIEDHHHFALSVISYIGLCTSVLALLIVFLTFTLIRFLNLPRHLIHANLALSLAIAHMTFMFGIDKTESKVLCKSLAILLHYLFLAAFCWMALEGVVLYLMLVKVFKTSISTNKTKLIFVACGWGIPIVIVGVSSAVYHEGYGTRDFCWLSMNNHFIWAFVAPVLAIITFNFVCLGFTFYIMTKNSNRCSPERKVDKLRYWVRSCCLLTCILGVTWLLGVFFVNKQTLFMAYLFSFLNGFQGVMIFLLHCVGDRKIRSVYINLFNCRSKTYGMSSSGGKLGRVGNARDSSSEHKQGSKKRLVKQRTVSSLLRSSVMQHVEEVKQCDDEKTPEQITDESNGRLTSVDSDVREEIPQSPEKASTPLLKRSRRVDMQTKRV